MEPQNPSIREHGESSRAPRSSAGRSERRGARTVVHQVDREFPPQEPQQQPQSQADPLTQLEERLTATFARSMAEMEARISGRAAPRGRGRPRITTRPRQVRTEEQEDLWQTPPRNEGGMEPNPEPLPRRQMNGGQH
ncbi:hypothetical protein ACLOJK_003780 [Asimina triloba]